MTNHIARTFFYAAGWFFVAWNALRNGYGDPSDHLLVASGLSLIHGACACWIGNTRRVLRFALLVPYALASAAILAVLLLYGTFIRSGGLIDADVVRAVLQTNPHEALEYLRRLLSPSDALASLSLGILLVAAFPTHSFASNFRTTAALSLCIIAGAIAVQIGSMVLTVPLKIYATEYFTELNSFRSVLSSRKSHAISAASSDFVGTAVVIVGESTSRLHMSKYGYFRPTTPKLDARGSELIAFTDVISAHSHTVPALAAALTSSGATEQQKFFARDSIDIISLARAAGFNVHWISNQNEFGIFDNPITAIARQANATQFISSALGENWRRSAYDGSMMPLLREALADPKSARSLVFMHLYTDHWPYCWNYPPEFDRFEELPEQQFFGNEPAHPGIKCYDNGILYIDSLVDQAIDIVNAAAEPTVLLYFSDHGEAMALDTGHDSFRHSSYQIEVPLLVWANDAFRSAYGEKLAAARSNVDRPYSTARLFHSIADLIGITHSSVSTRHSLFSADLVDMPRTSLGGRIKYDQWSAQNDYRENGSINIRKLGELYGSVWAHRTNSLGALWEATSSHFSGVEMDLVFVNPDECFHVYHPPVADVSLSLSQMLAASAGNPHLKLWLDWKNASATNMRAAIGCLDALDQQYHIRSRSLVETGSDAVFAETNLLDRAGYTHAYYLPTEAVLDCVRTCDDAGASELAARIMKAVEHGGYSGITFDWRLKGFVRERLLPWARRRKLALYSWDMSIDIAKDRDAVAQIDEHFATISLAGLLVTFPSVFKR